MTRGFVLLAASVVASGLVMAQTVAADDSDLQAFRARRGGYAAALAQPIAACVVRRDTSHAVFRGCIDWHSSVHGMWALIAYGRITGDRQYENLVLSLLDPARLALEREDLRRRPDFEMPYGRAWFLRLAVEYKRAFKDGRLDSLAQDVANSLMAYYDRVEPDPVSTAYESATWALINLLDFGESTGDAGIVAFVKAKVLAGYLGRAVCPLQAVEVETREFMAVCTNWAWLVGRILPKAAFADWLDTFLPDDLVIEPIGQAASVHQAGLNFSRAWGLWELYRITGKRRFLTAFLGHFETAFAREDIWNGDYGRYAHWVAQFGMLALALSDDAPSKP